MNIPEQIKVGNLTYKVAYVSQEFLQNIMNNFDNKYGGSIDYINCTININYNLTKQKQEETFIHYLIHAIFEFNNIEDNEDNADRIAKTLHLIFNETCTEPFSSKTPSDNMCLFTDFLSGTGVFTPESIDSYHKRVGAYTTSKIL